MSVSSKAPRAGCGALIRNEKNEILLVKRLRDPEADYWGFPGGKVDFGETDQQATIREVKEELGIAIKLSSLAHLVNYIDLENDQHWLAPVYNATIVDGIPSIQEPEALSDWKWFSEDNLPAPLTEASHQTLGKLKLGP